MSVRFAAVLGVVAGCHFSADFSGTSYRCDNGQCPSGYTCIADTCVLPGGGDAGDAAMADALDADLAIPWWNTSWGKRANLTITNNAAGALPTGFPVSVVVDLAMLESASASYNELRVVRWDGTTWTELTRFEQITPVQNLIWFDLVDPLPTSTSTYEYWLYFDNPGALAAPANGAMVFPFFDGFDGTSVDTTLWAVQGAPSEGSMNLTLNPSDSVRTMSQFAVGYAVAASLLAPPNAPRFWAGFQRETDFSDGDPWLVWINRAANDSDAPPTANPATIWPETYISSIGMNNPSWGPAETLDTVKHYYTVERFSDRVIYKYEENEVYTYVLPMADNDDLQVRLCNEGSKPIEFGAVFVRPVRIPDPAATIGATQLQ
ncbi:MAG TPA: DUF2341 domain-containing protein [Kofleriaceae bacterium]|nr:DUF2341 domain-containing protein [Kofleriaceae bacterium]